MVNENAVAARKKKVGGQEGSKRNERPSSQWHALFRLYESKGGKAAFAGAREFLATEPLAQELGFRPEVDVRCFNRKYKLYQQGALKDDDTKRLRESRYAPVQQETIRFIRHFQKNHGKSNPTYKTIKTQAIDIAQRLGYQDFKASDPWINKTIKMAEMDVSAVKRKRSSKKSKKNEKNESGELLPLEYVDLRLLCKPKPLSEVMESPTSVQQVSMSGSSEEMETPMLFSTTEEEEESQKNGLPSCGSTEWLNPDPMVSLPQPPSWVELPDPTPILQREKKRAPCAEVVAVIPKKSPRRNVMAAPPIRKARSSNDMVGRNIVASSGASECPSKISSVGSSSAGATAGRRLFGRPAPKTPPPPTNKGLRRFVSPASSKNTASTAASTPTARPKQIVVPLPVSCSSIHDVASIGTISMRSSSSPIPSVHSFPSFRSASIASMASTSTRNMSFLTSVGGGSSTKYGRGRTVSSAEVSVAANSGDFSFMSDVSEQMGTLGL